MKRKCAKSFIYILVNAAVRRARKLSISALFLSIILIFPVLASAVNLGLLSPASLQEDYPNSIVIIDGSLNQPDILASKIHHSKVYELDARFDGIEQISKILSQNKNLESVHILSHGGMGYITLGSGLVNQTNLVRYQAELQGWNQAMASDADILFYGCNTAKGKRGRQFLQSIRSITGADIAGSTNITGGSAFGGDWDLEYSVGNITTKSLNIKKYFHTLVGDESAATGDNGVSFNDDGRYVLLSDSIVDQDVIDQGDWVGVSTYGSGSSSVSRGIYSYGGLDDNGIFFNGVEDGVTAFSLD